MTNEQIKQAYVISKAAKGVKHFKELQKEAMQKQAGEFGDVAKQIAGDYAKPTLIPAGIGAVLGAIINGARGKSILNGMLLGGGIAGLSGAGYKAYSNYANANKKDKPDAE